MSTIQTIDNELPSTARPKINQNFQNLNTDKMEKAANLSDLTNVSTARTNLGLGNAATKSVGTGANEVAAGNHNHTSVYAPLVHTHAEYEETANKGVADGYASLDSSGKVPAAQIPSGVGGVPAGSIISYAGSSTPSTWLLCDGSAVSRTTYADLFTAIGTTYGNGDGSTTFNLPNLKGRVPVGLDSGQTEFDAVGETGGAKTHTLSTAEMPSHSHTISLGVSGGGSLLTDAERSRTPITNTTTQTTSSAGSGSAHNNLQPYIVLNFIIKT